MRHVEGRASQPTDRGCVTGAWGYMVFAANPGCKSHDSNLFSGPRPALPSHDEFQESSDLSSAFSGEDKQSWSTLEGEVDLCLTCWGTQKQFPNPQRQKKKKYHAGEFLPDFTSHLTAILRDASSLLWKNKQPRSIEFPYIKQHLLCLELWGAPSNALISGDCPERARPGPAAEGGGLMLQMFLEIWSLILIM